ncbi:hypothetical protein [Wolbachia endosymbiont of Pentidionis agamae]|uniref:hypothetical protein n=1 Tax=Wolbachia endosymbiont of Pentidionis agamae TaxID=3110435 RepID=UPI002FCE6F12
MKNGLKDNDNKVLFLKIFKNLCRIDDVGNDRINILKSTLEEIIEYGKKEHNKVKQEETKEVYVGKYVNNEQLDREFRTIVDEVTKDHSKEKQKNILWKVGGENEINQEKGSDGLERASIEVSNGKKNSLKENVKDFIKKTVREIVRRTNWKQNINVVLNGVVKEKREIVKDIIKDYHKLNQDNKNNFKNSVENQDIIDALSTTKKINPTRGKVEKASEAFNETKIDDLMKINERCKELKKNQKESKKPNTKLDSTQYQKNKQSKNISR